MPKTIPAEFRWNVLILALLRTATRRGGKTFLASDLVLTVVELSHEAKAGTHHSLGTNPSSDYRSGADWNEIFS